VAAALGDQQAALFGQTCFEPGTAKNTYGTGSFFLMNTGADLVRSDQGLLSTIGFQRRGDPVQYALEGSIFVTGGAVDWLVEIDLLDDPEQAESIARQVDSSDGVYVVPAFTGLGAPYWDGRARGTIIGLTRGTKRAHLVRATLEAIAYQTRAVVEAMEQDSDIDVQTLKVDGGAVANDLLCQLQADLLSVKVIRPQVDETTALGAAYAAGLAVGYWDSLAELKAHWQEDRSFTPTIPTETASSRFDRWEAAVERARDWAE
jgi:glycerol kinase